MADKYKSGTVTTGRLLDCITSMVDLPKLDKWKLEELKRMLDPMNDNRYVDAASWSVVGQSWVEMMLNPGKQSWIFNGANFEFMLNFENSWNLFGGSSSL